MWLCCPVGAFCFNTQPPEGGWYRLSAEHADSYCFNTQPPEGGWEGVQCWSYAGYGFNTQPPEGGWLVCSRK